MTYRRGHLLTAPWSSMFLWAAVTSICYGKPITTRLDSTALFNVKTLPTDHVSEPFLGTAEKLKLGTLSDVTTNGFRGYGSHTTAVAETQSKPNIDSDAPSTLSSVIVPVTVTTSVPTLAPTNIEGESRTPIPGLANATVGTISRNRELRKRKSYFWQRPVNLFKDTESPHINLINATPYRWRKGYRHSYQMGSWDKAWPEFVESGHSVEILANPKFGTHAQDNAGEVVYHLEGTSVPMSFMVEYRKGRKHAVWVKYLENLATIGNAKLSEHNLGMQNEPGGVGFILAGKEGDFVSNDAPAAWMQAQLPHIGHLPLREIVMPMSHHAGSIRNGRRISMGSPDNTQTQYVPLSEQINAAGVRVLDVRLARTHGEYREGHLSSVLGKWHGMLGAHLEDMIDTVNAFCEEHPGELFIWEVHAMDAWNLDRGYKPLDDQDRRDLYAVFKKLKYRVSVPDNVDITKSPLRYFIGNKTSAVLVRFHESWVRKGHFPGGAEGFVSSANFPVAHRWSETGVPAKMAEDQLKHLHQNRPRPDSTLFRSDWLLTQVGLEAVAPQRSIIEMGLAAWAALYNEMWKGINAMTYPNWISMDGIEGSGLKTMAMAMNHCLAAKQCGSLNGKVGGEAKKPMMLS